MEASKKLFQLAEQARDREDLLKYKILSPTQSFKLCHTVQNPCYKHQSIVRVSIDINGALDASIRQNWDKIFSDATIILQETQDKENKDIHIDSSRWTGRIF